jgi:hypothetical protein
MIEGQTIRSSFYICELPEEDTSKGETLERVNYAMKEVYLTDDKILNICLSYDMMLNELIKEL